MELVKWFTSLTKEEREDFEKHMADGLEHLVDKIENMGAGVATNPSSVGMVGEDAGDRGVLFTLLSAGAAFLAETIATGVFAGVAIAAENGQWGVVKGESGEEVPYDNDLEEIQKCYLGSLSGDC